MLTHFILFLKVHIEFLDAGDVIKIEGPPTDADKAREILEEQAKELMTKMDFTEINVDAKYHKHIIGKGGSTVNKLKQETEVMINIPDSDKAPSNVIRIEGNKDGVKKAKEVSSLLKVVYISKFLRQKNWQNTFGTVVIFYAINMYSKVS